MGPGTVAWSVAMPLGMQAVLRWIPASGTFFCEDLVMKKFLQAFLKRLPLIQIEQLSVNGERMYASTGKLPLGVLPRKSVVRITDRHNITSAVYHGHKAINQTDKTKSAMVTSYWLQIFVYRI